LPSLSVKEEISWSRNAPAHLALLQRETSTVVSPPLEFSAASIKPDPPRNIPIGEYGFGCRGIDGVQQAPFGNFDPNIVPRGRCIGGGVHWLYLVDFAYGLPVRYGPGIPAWARHDARPGEYFVIEATADNPSTATLSQLRQMLRTMLAKRFNLSTHRENQEVQGYTLRISRTAPKLKQGIGEEIPPYLGFKDGQPVFTGKSTLDKLAWQLAGFINGALSIDVPIVDKTGLAGIYEWEFPVPLAGGGGRGAAQPQAQGALPGTEAVSARVAQRALSSSAVLEDYAGLKLQPEKVEVETLVIDRVEKPSQN
jgi:uncharacterized protein (TIGR03435 family)